MEKLYDHVIERQELQELREHARDQEDRLERALAALEALSKGIVPAAPTPSSSSSSSSSQVQGGHHNAQTNVVLNVRKRSKEDVARIAASDIRAVIEAGGGTPAIIGGMLRLIYHKVPENRNAYRLAWAKHKKDSSAMVFEGSATDEGRWVPRSRGALLPAMIEKSVDVTFDHQFELLGDKATSMTAKETLDRTVKNLAKDCPIGGEIAPALLTGVSSEQRSVLLANRPEK